MLLKKNSVLWLVVLVIGTLILIWSINRSNPTQQSVATSSRSCQASQNDIVMLQREIDNMSASGGGIVEMKACQYVITKPFVLKSNVHLKGAGLDKTTIMIESEFDDGTVNNNKVIVTEQDSHNISITDLTVDGNKQERKSLINDPYAHTIDVAFVDNFEINNIKVINAPSASIMLYNSQNGTVENSTILDSGSNGILALKDIDNITIANNMIDQTDHQNGIFISYQDGHSSSNIRIENNIVKYAGDFGIEVGHIVPEGDEQHQNIIVRNNEIISATNAGIAFRSVSEGMIEDNTISGYGKNGGYGADGIFVEGGFNTSRNINVENNEVNQTFQSGDANAIYVTGIDGAEVVGNKVEGSRGNGIFVQASVLPDGSITADFNEGKRNFNEIHVRGNQFLNNKKSGIQFQGNNALGNSLEGNLIKGNGEFGIQIANLTLGSGFLVSENQISNNGKESLSIFKQNEIEIVSNDFNSLERNSKSLSFVNVQDVVVKNNIFHEKSWEELLGNNPSNNIINQNNRFQN
ncbi:right-handed parallel beta-helix repeat-containing protein [Bacillus sp. es.036]|uniref:right-handed parallel beta-helix repeat-containing protein n=1 Tax=Bacillus sp. es.036 TaxID=1761764 RepID=UPI000BF9BE6A|nr:right-handed parallel beta-helix repeat-containing protein [Bacillus sp. es.036]PFG15031.1 parallel beta helix pectate lyase-like protein [Bacillus sp. es.036]